MNLKNKKVVVTGGFGLIGSAIVKELISLEAYPIIIDLKNEKLKKLNEKKNMYDYIETDLTQIKQVSTTIKKIFKKHKDVSSWILCHYPKPKKLIKNIKDSKIIADLTNEHINSYCSTANEIAKVLAAKNGGSIVSFGSIFGSVAPNSENYINTGIKNLPHYSISKAGISSFSRYLASIYGKNKVRVNTIVSGGVINNQNKIFIKNYSKNTSLKRLAKPEEVARSAIFLVSDYSSYITGTDLIVDGGYLSL